MNKKIGLLGILLIFSLYSIAQVNLKPGKWRAQLLRGDGHQIPFALDIQQQKGKTVIYVVNGTERLKTQDIQIINDSLFIKMPVFESAFKVKIINKDSLNGVWVKGGSSKDLVMPFTAVSGKSPFPMVKETNLPEVNGKWKVEFTRANQTKRPAIGEFVQHGHQVSGSVLTPAGDYRYLDGVVKGDSLFLSTFDGVHALVLAAKIDGTILNGDFFSSASAVEKWTAVKDASFTLTPPLTAVKEGSDGKLNFSFKDLEGNTVSLEDKRFKGKVVVLQLMGSWCPNCMDEMAFLSEYYRKNKNRGVEIIALAYELSTDEARSRKSLERFKQQFNVDYPILNTGVTVGDAQRTEKTLPQLTEIKVFPTSIILDKNGVVSQINTSFYGPGTGEYYTKYKQEFEQTITSLLAVKP